MKNRLQKAKGGEFIVTEKGKILTLLTCHPLQSGDRIILEEISVPKSCVSFPVNWQNWIDKYAPGHHSWTLYEINSDTGALISCFSPSKGEWLSTHGETEFLPRLLTLPLEKISDFKKKRIGPSPRKKSEDHRQFWAPLLIYDGRTQTKSDFDVYETFWPSDDTPLSLAHITLYFDKQNTSFPFPYWMQIDNGVACAKIRVVDSGSKLQSVFVGMPKRDLIGSDLEKYENELYRLSVTCSLPWNTLRLSENGHFLTVTKRELERVLLKDHFYYFMIIPMRYSNEFAKTIKAWHYIT